MISPYCINGQLLIPNPLNKDKILSRIDNQILSLSQKKLFWLVSLCDFIGMRGQIRTLYDYESIHNHIGTEYYMMYVNPLITKILIIPVLMLW